MGHTIAFLMDPLSTLSLKKDSSLAMMAAASARGHRVYAGTHADLAIQGGICQGRFAEWTGWGSPQEPVLPDIPLTVSALETWNVADFDLVVIRTDPPFDMEYYYATLLLKRAVSQGARIINHPSAIRSHNEKCAILEFAEDIPPTCVTRRYTDIRAALQSWGKAVIKPLNSMGGAGIFILDPADPNLSVILETATAHETCTVMVQAYLPEIRDGDNRIWLMHGRVFPYAVSRIPQPGDHRGNMVRGGVPVVRPITAREQALGERLGPVLHQRGLHLVGLDVIGGYLTEINVTSPTGLRELLSAQPFDLGAWIWEPAGL